MTDTLKLIKICYSVGDPHIQTFEGDSFDTHQNGWKLLYSKGKLKIELEQALWNPGVSNASINKAVRYSEDNGTNWVTRQGGELLGPEKDEEFIVFSNPNVKLTVNSPDYSNFSWAQDKRIYDVFVSTNEYEGAKGQCVTDKSRRLLETSGGVNFPVNASVSKEQAISACSLLTSQQQNCVTDVRMANDIHAVDFIAEAFVQVEYTQDKLEQEALEMAANTTTTSKAPAFFEAILQVVLAFIKESIEERLALSLVVLICATLLIFGFFICCCVCICRCKHCCCFKVICLIAPALILSRNVGIIMALALGSKANSSQCCGR